MGTRLEFEGSIAGVKIIPAKADYSGQPSGGGLELTLKVEMPKAPRKPSVPYGFSRDGGSEWKECPEGEKESKEWLAALARWLRAVEAWEPQAAAHSARVQAYALLVGVGAVFANQPVNVVLTPSNQEMLPGLSLGLLAPVGEA